MNSKQKKDIYEKSIKGWSVKKSLETHLTDFLKLLKATIVKQILIYIKNKNIIQSCANFRVQLK